MSPFKDTDENPSCILLRAWLWEVSSNLANNKWSKSKESSNWVTFLPPSTALTLALWKCFECVRGYDINNIKTEWHELTLACLCCRIGNALIQFQNKRDAFQIYFLYPEDAFFCSLMTEWGCWSVFKAHPLLLSLPVSVSMPRWRNANACSCCQSPHWDKKKNDGC